MFTEYSYITTIDIRFSILVSLLQQLLLLLLPNSILIKAFSTSILLFLEIIYSFKKELYTLI